jgi:hypothetical protein
MRQVHSLKAHNSSEAHSPTQQLVASTQCSVCNKKFTTPGGLLSHQQAKQHYYLPCPTCSRNFTAPEDLSRHQADAHSPLSSSSSTGVNGHSLANGQRSTEQRVIHRCSECETRFDSLAELETHRVSHRKFPCSKCSLTFSSLIEWNGHFKRVHNKVQCSACNAVFTSEEILVSHGRYCPAIARPASSQSGGSKTGPSGSQNNGQVVCDFCNKGFNSREALQAHAATKHPSAAKCVICHLACSSPTALEDHVNTIHSCAVCRDGILRNAGTLADHMVEHSHPIRCKKCGTRYRSEQERALHFAAADNDHPICVRCQVGFEDDAALRMVSCQLGVKKTSCAYAAASAREFSAPTIPKAQPKAQPSHVFQVRTMSRAVFPPGCPGSPCSRQTQAYLRVRAMPPRLLVSNRSRRPYRYGPFLSHLP